MNDELSKSASSTPITPPNNTLGHGKKQSTIKTSLLTIVVLLSMVVGFAGGWLGGALGKNRFSPSSSTEQAKQIFQDESQLISSIVKEVGPSVVSVNVTRQSAQQDFFGNTRTAEQQSAGTGFVISDKGDILTNRHVVPASATAVSVTLSDGTILDNVEVVGRTADSDPLDIAFLRVKDTKGKTLKPVKLGDSNKMEVGYKVIAIGNALGQFQNSVTTGIISGYGRSVQAIGEGDQVENLQNLFQTDAAINQGNSGGPLVNADGEVIGINTAVAGDGAENIGFAIPINDVRGIVASVLNKGKVERPFLGVRYVSITDDYAVQNNLSVKRGAYLAPNQDGQPATIAGSPAEKAGLKEKDIITKVNGQAIDERNNLTSILAQHSVGDTVKLTVSRDGQEQTFDVTLTAAP